MTAPIVVRRYRPDDLLSLVELFRDTVRRVNSRDYSPEQIAAWAPDGHFNLDRWATLIEHFTVVAEVDGEIVGFADLRPDGLIDRFFVGADHQGHGVGRAMLSALTAEAERTGLRRVFAEVSITARPFFERQGFVVLTAQEVVHRGVAFVNYRMERQLARCEVESSSTLGQEA